MTKFEKVKYYYEQGLWTEEQVRNAVGKWITEEEYQMIVNQDASQQN